MSNREHPPRTIRDRDGDNVAVFVFSEEVENTVDTFNRAEKRVRMAESPMAPRIQAMGAKVNINRTITPAKYHASVP